MYEQRPDSTKEWKLIESLLNKSMDEQRKARRWGIFFKGLTFAYLFFALWLFAPTKWSAESVTELHSAVIDVSGIIMADAPANADDIVAGLREAFANDNVKGIILRIDSPGGSPVQSGLVYNEVMRLKGKHPEKKVYAAITDTGASGAYYIASAADEIYADQASVVGSIGVISAGFGYTEVLKKVGIERRVVSAGDNKSMLDPFLPVNEDEVKKFKELMGVVHRQFVESVRHGRGDRLKETDETFSGLFWVGEQALEMGLIDGLGSPGFVAREVIGAAKIVDYTVSPNPFEAFADRLGVSFAKGFAVALGIEPLQLR